MSRNRVFLILGLITILAGGMEVSTSMGADNKMGQGESGKREESGKKNGGLAIKDLPAPVPKVMDEIQRIGNEVGEGITKATGAGAEAVKKAFQEKKSE